MGHGAWGRGHGAWGMVILLPHPPYAPYPPHPQYPIPNTQSPIPIHKNITGRVEATWL